MNRANMFVPIVSLIIGLSFIGVIIWEQFEISRLLARNEQLEEAYDQPVKYFFIGDSNFTTSLDEKLTHQTLVNGSQFQ